MVAAVRARYDGRRRNPYNEVECGSHYARALASYGVLLAMSGFRHDGVDGTMALNPLIPGEFRGLYVTWNEWGVARRSESGEVTFEPKG